MRALNRTIGLATALMASHAYASESIVCHSQYVLLGESKETHQGPDLSVEIKPNGSAFGNVTDLKSAMTYSASLENGNGSVGLSVSDNKNAIAAFGDLSAAGKTLRLVFADKIFSVQGIIDISCARQ